MGASHSTDVGASPEAAAAILERRSSKLFLALSSRGSWARAREKATNLLRVCIAWDGCPAAQHPKPAFSAHNTLGLLGDPRAVLDAYLRAWWALEFLARGERAPGDGCAELSKGAWAVLPRMADLAARVHGAESLPVAELKLAHAQRALQAQRLALARRLAEAARVMLLALRGEAPAVVPDAERAARSAYCAAWAFSSGLAAGWVGAAQLSDAPSTHIDALRLLASAATLSDEPVLPLPLPGAPNESALPAAAAYLAALAAALGAESPHLWQGHHAMMLAAWKKGEGSADSAIEWANKALAAFQRSGALPSVAYAEILELVGEANAVGGGSLADARRLQRVARKLREELGASDEPNARLRALIADAERPQAAGGKKDSGSFGAAKVASKFAFNLLTGGSGGE
jgi:hypothetical protein